MTADKGTQDDWRIDRRTALKAAGLASVGVFGGTTAFSGVAGAQPINPTELAALAYVPLSGTAEVAIVNLEEDELQHVADVNPDSDEFSADDLLTNRISIDEDGVGWALNTASNFPDDDGPEDIQGHLARVLPELDGDDNVVDAEVTIWDIGAPGDRPRALRFDDDGILWVAFYWGEYLLAIDTDELSEGDTIDEAHDHVDRYDIPDDEFDGVPAPYAAEWDPDPDSDKLWLVSRRSRVPKEEDIDHVVFTFDTVTHDIEVHDTGLIAPYFIAFDSEEKGYQVWVSDADNTGSPPVGWDDEHNPMVAFYHDRTTWVAEGVDPDEDTSQLRGISVDQVDTVFVGSTNGRVVELEQDNGGFTVNEINDVGAEIVGVGIDHTNRKWPIDIAGGTMNLLINDLEIDFGEDTLPYAYTFAVLEPELGEICVEKTLTEDLEAHFEELLADGTITEEEYENRLEGWEFELYDAEDEDLETTLQTITTDSDGEACFDPVEPGDYVVCETSERGTELVDEGLVDEDDLVSDGCIDVDDLEAGETVTITFENDLAEFRGCTPGFWCNPANMKGWWTDEEEVGDYFTDDTLGETFDDDGLTPGWLVVEERGGGRGRGSAGHDLAEKTLHEAVCDLSGGPDLAHAQNQLAGHGTAALLNAAHEHITYPMTEDEVIDAVQEALDTDDIGEVLAQKDEFDDYNNLGCTLNAFGEPEEE